jgi:hypothetical protein
MGTEYGLKIAGDNAGRLTKLLTSVFQQAGRTKGKVRVANMLKSGKPLTVFEIKQGDLEKFAKEARKFGVKYAVIRSSKDEPNSMVDVLVSKDDESKINRIITKFGFEVLDTDAVIQSIEREREAANVPDGDKGVVAKSAAERLADEFVAAPLQREAIEPEDPTRAQTKSPSQSEPTSKMSKPSERTSSHEQSDEMERTEARPSVRKEIEKERNRRAEEARTKPKTSPTQTKHQQPVPSGKEPRAPKLPAKER